MTTPPFDPTIFVSTFAWVWATYGERIATRTTKEVWDRVEWQVAEKRYASKVKTLYGTTRILGKPKPIPLTGEGGIYTDVHILDKPTALRRFTIDELEKHYDETGIHHRLDERHDGLTVLQDTDKLFILGKPGAGKTTFCKHVVVQAVEGRIQKVPIFVPLKELTDSGQSVLDFVVEQFDICNFPDAQPFVEQLLRAGKAIVLFDGLDEVQQVDDKQVSLATEIKNFANKYDKSQYLITCRIAATEYTFEHFTYVEMADFTLEQVQVFAGKWFSGDAIKRRGFLEGLHKPEHRTLREMAQTPLLLTLLCLAFEETLSFPHRRVEIYEEALDALLKRWDASRNIQRDDFYRKLGPRRKRQMLARIAATTSERGKDFVPQKALAEQIEDYLRQVPSADADEDIDGIVVLKAIEAQHGIFIERAQRIYSFAHSTFQEYFTALYIVDNAARDTLRRLIQCHISNTRWREVFLLTASMLDEADHFFDLLILGCVCKVMLE